MGGGAAGGRADEITDRPGGEWSGRASQKEEEEAGSTASEPQCHAQLLQGRSHAAEVQAEAENEEPTRGHGERSARRAV